MNIETDKKERKIICNFGTSLLEKYFFKFLSKELIKFEKDANKVHNAKQRIVDNLWNRMFACKKDT